MVAAVLVVALAACGGGGPATPAVPSAPTATPLITAGPEPTPTPVPVVPVSGEVPAGLYAWTTFEPNLRLEIPAGWQVGHRSPDYFDLFPLVTTTGAPGVGFGRFAGVHGPDGAVALVTAAGVVEALVANPALHVERLGPAERLGLRGEAVRISVDAPATPLFEEARAPFRFDPGWTTQCWFLDVEGGVLTTCVFGHAGDEAADLATAQPLIDGVSLAP